VFHALIFFQTLPAESVTEVRLLVEPEYTLADSTKRSPAALGLGNVAVNEVDATVTVWVAAGPVPVTTRL
jgi:hypothetical protein